MRFLVPVVFAIWVVVGSGLLLSRGDGAGLQMAMAELGLASVLSQETGETR